MLYVTGDTHGDYERFTSSALKKLKKGDTLFICGDFGFIWDGSKNEEKMLKKIGKLKYNVCFIDGTHENFERLRSYEVSEFKGGNFPFVQYALAASFDFHPRHTQQIGRASCRERV